MREAQVVIVGGGPAGSSTAYFLAKAGIDVLVLDRAKFPRDKPCSEYLSPQASRVLDAMSALEEIENSGAAQLTGMRVHAPNGATIHGEFGTVRGFRGYRDRGLAVRRTILDEILLDRARSAGARVEESVRVTDVVRDSHDRVAGVTAIADGVTKTIHSNLVIGADGLRSVVGRRLGLIRASVWPKRIALVTHFRNVRGVGAYGEMHVDHEGYLGFADVGNGLTNVAVVVPTSRAPEVALDRTEFLESWIAERPQIAEHFSEAERVAPVQATGPFASSARRAYAPGAVLVGDAADFFDPFTGEGIYAALRGGELLADYVTDAIAEPAPMRDKALSEYDRARHAEFSGKWKVEKIVGAAVAFPALMNRAAKVLSRRRDMADTLIGVVGDFVPAREVLRPRYLLRLMFGPT